MIYLLIINFLNLKLAVKTMTNKTSREQLSSNVTKHFILLQWDVCYIKSTEDVKFNILIDTHNVRDNII